MPRHLNPVIRLERPVLPESSRKKLGGKGSGVAPGLADDPVVGESVAAIILRIGLELRGTFEAASHGEDRGPIHENKHQRAA